MTSIAKNELYFNLSCYELAKNNLSLAYKYVIDLSPNFLSRYLPESTSASFVLKNNRSNLGLFKNWGFSTKECLDIFTQLSPALSMDFINSPEFKEDEVKVRYSKDTRREFVEKYFEEKIKNKDSKMSYKMSTISNRLGFTAQDYMDISLNILAKSSKIKYSDALKNDVALYIKNTHG